MDIDALLASPEGKTLEFKRDLSSPEKAVRSVVAFANTAGGTIVIISNVWGRKMACWYGLARPTGRLMRR